MCDNRTGKIEEPAVSRFQDVAMTIEQIRNHYDAQPFRPFVGHLADGARCRSTTANSSCRLLVTDLEIKPTANGSRKRRKA
jgi:hypothetical protein